MTTPLYPDVIVRLTGRDGSAGTIIGAVCRALRAVHGNEVADKFATEAMDGDYDHLLRTCMKFVEVE